MASMVEVDVRTYNVLNLGAGWQSSRVLLGACRGELPKFDVAVFADTRWEPRAVYENLEFLRGEAARAGIPVEVRSAGDIRADAIEFRQMRKSLDGRRHASLPTFIRNPDGTQGRVRRQCTGTYKIEVVERFVRRELLGLRPSARVPKGVTVRQWFGISDDEATRASFPGVFRERKVRVGTDLFGEPVTVPIRRWHPTPWKVHVYPLLNETWHPDRTIRVASLLPGRETRADCGAWLARHHPGRTFPRSACIGCPFRSNAEWKEMRDNRPDEWADACDFDDAQRSADVACAARRRLLVGASYVHRQMVPLREADLDGIGEEKSGGCGSLFDGQDGFCDI
jgi:hypothetical protein